MLVLGLAVGVATAAAGLGLRASVLHALPIGLAPLSLVLAMAVGGIGGVIPALAAARGSAVSALRGRGRVRRSRGPRSAAGLGLRELLGVRRLEALLGVGAVAIGAGMLGGV